MGRARFATLVTLLLGLYSLYDAAVFYPGDGQRVLYAAAVAPLFAGCALAFGWARLDLHGWLATCFLVALAFLPLVAALGQPDPILLYVIGDFASLLLPAAMILVGSASPGLFRARPGLWTLGGALLIGALLAPVTGRAETARFMPPSLLLVAIGWAVVFRCSSRAARAGGWSLLIVSMVLIVLSATRSTLLLAVGMGVAGWMLVHGFRRAALLGASGLLLAVLVLVVMPESQRARVFDALRVTELAEGSADQSLQTRFDEVADVMRNIERDWGPMQWLIGSGHGATWTIHEAAPNPNNVLDDGRVHQVHVTPVLLLYRCGLLGLAAYLGLAILALAPWLRPRGTTQSAEAMVFQLALVGFFLDSMVRVVLADPIFSFTLAGALWWRVRPEGEVESAA